MTDTPATMDLPAYARSLGITIIGEDGGMPLLAVDFGPMVEGRPQHFPRRRRRRACW